MTQKAAAGAKRIFDILDHVSTCPIPRSPVPTGPPGRGHRDARIGFRYGNRAVIRGLDLTSAPAR